MIFIKGGMVLLAVIKKEEIDKLEKFLKTPKTLGEIAFNMEWSYSGAYQKMKVLSSGGRFRSIKRGKETVFYSD